MRVRAKRNLPALLFLIPFAAFWAAVLIGGLASLIEPLDLVSLLLLVLIFALWLMMVALIGWYSTGVTVVRVKRGDLEIGFRLFGVRWLRRFEGTNVRDLSVADSPPYFAGRSAMPFPGVGRCIRFSYGTRTIHAATGLSEADAKAIYTHLRTRASASGLEF